LGDGRERGLQQSSDLAEVQSLMPEIHRPLVLLRINVELEPPER